MRYLSVCSGIESAGHAFDGIIVGTAEGGAMINLTRSNIGKQVHNQMPLVAFGWNKSESQTMRVDGNTTDAIQASVTSNPAIAIQGGATRENPDSGPDGVGVRDDNTAFTVEARAEVQAVAFAQNTRDEVREMVVSGALAGEPGMKQQSYIRISMQVRRLTPIECERLMGMPDHWTAITYNGKPAADGPRYKALGNSMVSSVMFWIGQRVQNLKGVEA